jgi:hypothetical protein
VPERDLPRDAADHVPRRRERGQQEPGREHVEEEGVGGEEREEQEQPDPGSGTLIREISAISSSGLSPSVAALSRAFNYRLIL